MRGVFGPIIEQKISLGLCETFSDLPTLRCVLSGVPFVALSCIPAVLWEEGTLIHSLTLLVPILWVAGKLVANLDESCCLLQRPFDSGLKTEGNRLATFLNYVSTGPGPFVPSPLIL